MADKDQVIQRTLSLAQALFPDVGIPKEDLVSLSIDGDEAILTLNDGPGQRVTYTSNWKRL